MLAAYIAHHIVKLYIDLYKESIIQSVPTVEYSYGYITYCLYTPLNASKFRK